MNRWLVCVTLGLLAGAALATPRGQAIYLQGQSLQGPPIRARPGNQRIAHKAALLPCANCHGEDGRGRAEGGVQPADIRPETLRRVATVGLRSRPPYTPALLARALRQGLDSAGQPLDRVMPRYRLSAEQFKDLAAYLSQLGHEPVPGVSDDRIRINVIGAPQLLAPPDRLYGRQIELHHGHSADALLTLDASADGSASVAAAEHDHRPTLVLHAGTAQPGPYTWVMSATDDAQMDALQRYARQQLPDGAHVVLLRAAGCDALAERLAERPDTALVLMTTSAAALCALHRIPLALDRRIIVATSTRPDPLGSAQAQLSIATTALAQAGRVLTRTTLRKALAAQRTSPPPVTLMSVDLRTQQLLPLVD